MKISKDEIFFLNEFEKASKVNAKDCVIFPNNITFLIEPKSMGIAIGKNGQTVSRLRKKMQKNIELMEYYSDPAVFFKKAISPIKIDEIEKEANQLTIKMDSENKRKIRERMNKFKRIKDIMKRNHSIQNIHIK